MADQVTTPAPTPTPVDMFGPDGQVHEVNANDVQSALSSGGEFAHQLKGPDGQIHYVRHSQLGEALKSGGVPMGALDQISQTQTKTQPPSPPGFFASTAQALGIPTSVDELKNYGINTAINLSAGGLPIAGMVRANNLAGGVKAVAGTIPQIYQAGKSAVQDVSQLQAPTSVNAANTDLGLLARAGATYTLGEGGRQTVNKLAAGDYRGAGGTYLGTALPYLAMGLSGTGSPEPMTLSDAASKITDAVNPPPKSMSSFESSVQQHLPKAIEAAREQGLPLAGRTDLAKAFTAAAEKARGTYYNDMLGPVKDVPIDTSGIGGYQGPTTYYNTATLGQLDSRLAEINSTLSPAYEKGGASARAAISAESKSALTAEANAIRSRLYQEISNRTGIDQDAVASTKASMGSMYNIADKITTAVNKERFAANQAAQGANPPHSIGEAVIRFGNKAFRNTFNNPDKNVVDAVQRAQ